MIISVHQIEQLTVDLPPAGDGVDRGAFCLMRRRMMLDMELKRCQLSKLYAYNGLMFSTGTRVDGIRIDKPHRVIVVDNPEKLMRRVPVITVEENSEPGKYYRVETLRDIILTRSQFKADRWLREKNMSWQDYWKALRKYRHALYITNTNKEKAEELVALNYQFLSTVSIQPEEFRPTDLPDGWSCSPETCWMFPRVLQMPAERTFCDAVNSAAFAEASFYVPGAAYEHDESCTLLRNPHIARNEELQLSVYPVGDELREDYFGHLTDVIMVPADSLAAERLA